MSTAAVTPDPYASIAKPIQADPYAAIAKPIAPPPTAEKSLWQKAKDNFNANTQGAKPGDGVVKGALENFGAGAGDVVRAVAHLPTTVSATMSQGVDDLKNGMDPVGMQGVRLAQSLHTQPMRTLGQLGTGALIGEAGGAMVAPIMRGAGVAGEAAVDAAQAAKAKLYPTAKSIPQQTIAARNLAKSLVIDPQGASNFIRAATDEAGTVVDYAQKNNIPINSKVDFANAAKQTADAVQAHFDDAILGPNAKQITPVPANYRGATVGEGPNATLGAINDRIDTINQELNPNYRKGLASQTNAANISDGDLLAEKRALTNTLHDKLARATGLTPSDIAAARQQAGKLRTIADESNLSANRDLTASGRQAAGGTSPSSLGTKTGIADRAWQKLQGGADVIGNRELLKNLQGIRPQPLNLPQPTSTGVAPPAVSRTPITGPSTTIQGPDYTPDPNAAAAWQQQVAARQSAPLGAAKLRMHDPSLTVADVQVLKSTDAGRQILVKASSLAPLSSAMESLFPQIRAALAHR